MLLESRLVGDLGLAQPLLKRPLRLTCNSLYAIKSVLPYVNLTGFLLCQE